MDARKYKCCVVSLCSRCVMDATTTMCWQGGTSYVEGDKLDLNLGGMPLAELCERLKPRCRFIALKLPLNFNLEGACVSRRGAVLRMVWGFDTGMSSRCPACVVSRVPPPRHLVFR